MLGQRDSDITFTTSGLRFGFGLPEPFEFRTQYTEPKAFLVSCNERGFHLESAPADLILGIGWICQQLPKIRALIIDFQRGEKSTAQV